MALTGLVTKGLQNNSIVTRGYLGRGIVTAIRGMVLDFKAQLIDVFTFKAEE